MQTVAKRDGRSRVVVEGLSPCVDCGAFPIKRSVGESVTVHADIFTDGHDQVRALLRYRQSRARRWQEVVMSPEVNDRWTGSFSVTELTDYCYTICAWVDHFLSWRQELLRRVDPDDISLALTTGSELVAAAAERATGDDARQLGQWADELRGTADLESRRQLAASEALDTLMLRHADRSLAGSTPQTLDVVVEPPQARFSTWYELFPRSCVSGPGEHGTFRDVEARLPYVAGMGFDVLYLPPIHPIGQVQRKGPNNRLHATADDPGSPWAIGSEDGGHKSIHPDLGTLEDFRHLVQRARDHGLAIALDIAFQCAPDHPYVTEHPSWFRWRPDGTVQFAENPPKKYQDIYPFNFESDDWQALWEELKSVFEYWIEQGVTIFRVDNPHTKPFAFWHWLIAELRREHPGVILLSEAFTRPKVMHRLAKVGFSQSYTYFTWRNSKWELTEYGRELCQGPGREYFRPNLWPNTPDILHEYLQFGGRSGFMVRLVLAATMGASYGIYGPAFELCEHRPREPGSEEYLDSEKYQIRVWDIDRPDSLRRLIARVNRIRHENAALQHDHDLDFHDIDNDMLLCYSKRSIDLDNVIVVVVNLDPHHRQSGWVALPSDRFALAPGESYEVHDLLSGAHYLWQTGHNYVELDPGQGPAHVFRLQRHAHTERDFDAF